MLKRLRVQNFKCLRDVTVELGAMTIFIGPNDSGKTSMLDALALLSETTKRPLSEVFGDHESSVRQLLWGHHQGLSLGWHVEGESEGGPFAYDLEVGPDRQIIREKLESASLSFDCGRGRDVVLPVRNGQQTFRLESTTGLEIVRLQQASTATPILDVLSCSSPVRLEPDAMRQPSLPAAEAVLSATGGNLAAVLDRLLAGPDREAVVAMEHALREAVPTLMGISTPPAPNGNGGSKTIKFRLAANAKKPVVIACENVSDGALLVTAFLALAYGETPGMLMIEEPENGLHPKLLETVVKLLRRISTGAVGSTPRQVILTTHSPLLLNNAEPDEVRVVFRDAQTGTRVAPLHDTNRAQLHEFGLGELWYHIGEEGLAKDSRP